MSRRIYVAGGSDERLECRADIATLETGGWRTTFNWTLDENYLSQDRAAKIRNDLRGVIEAPFLWLRTPKTKSEGAGVELGAAIVLRDMLSFPALGLPHPRCIIVSGPWNSGNRLFTHAADLKFSSHADALRWLLDYAP
jgi:hypothetical protein